MRLPWRMRAVSMAPDDSRLEAGSPVPIHALHGIIEQLPFRKRRVASSQHRPPAVLRKLHRNIPQGIERPLLLSRKVPAPRYDCRGRSIRRERQQPFRATAHCQVIGRSSCSASDSATTTASW
jgi:hypothetical protein